MAKKKRDFLNGDHSFKNWFKIMWSNGYIFGFLVGLAGMIAQIVMWDDMINMIQDNAANSTGEGIITVVAMIIPSAIVGIVSYKGFWQHWNDLKNGRSR